MLVIYGLFETVKFVGHFGTSKSRLSGNNYLFRFTSIYSTFPDQRLCRVKITKISRKIYNFTCLTTYISTRYFIFDLGKYYGKCFTQIQHDWFLTIAVSISLVSNIVFLRITRRVILGKNGEIFGVFEIMRSLSLKISRVVSV